MTAVITAATAASLALVPAVATSSCTVTVTGGSLCSSRRMSLLTAEGAGVLVPLAVPVLLSLVPVLIPGRRSSILAAAAMTAAALLAAASVGLLFAPALVSAWLAVREARQARRRSPAPAG